MKPTSGAIARRIAVSVLAVSGIGLIAIVLLVLVAHFNPLTGVYSYDPRHEEPNGFFVVNRPEATLAQKIKQQIAQAGSYPPGIEDRIVGIEPVRVDVATYSDWAAEARVTTQLVYANGTVATEVFRFRDAGSEGMLMPIAPGTEMSIRARFGNLADCVPQEPGKSYCDIKLDAE